MSDALEWPCVVSLLDEEVMDGAVGAVTPVGLIAIGARTKRGVER